MSFSRLFTLILMACFTWLIVDRVPAQVTLDLSGAGNMWFYGYYGQMGNRGFFGEYDVDASSTGTFASLNSWVGNQDVNSLVSGANAGISSFALDVTPKWGNDWAMLKARYNITSYNTSTAPGSVVPISPGQLTLWSAVVRTPLGTVRFGKQIFEQGFSLQFAQTRTTEYLMLDRTYPVPDILGCLVGAGVLPKKAMSWFNPDVWPRYRPTDYPEKKAPFENKEYKEPEDELYRHPKENKSLFKVWESEQLECLKQRRNCLMAATTASEAAEKCGEVLPDDSTFAAAREELLTEIRTRITEITCHLAEQEPDSEKKKEAASSKDDAEVPPEEKCNTPLNKSYAWGHMGPGCLRIGFGFFPWENLVVPVPAPVPSPYFNFWNPQDLGINQTQNFLALAAYSSTDLEFGIGCLRSVYHQGPELRPRNPVTGLSLTTSTPTFERYVTEGWAYLKYNNGRYFFNTELDWFNRVHRFQRSLDGTFFGTPDNVDGSGSLFASKYWESWRYMAEAGFWCGPFALRGFYCFMPGPDRRHGVYIDRQPFVQEQFQQAFGLFDPYSILLAYRFGSGVNAPGHISDASVYALKLDYALASNLVITGSFLRAIRNSHGYAIGYIRPNIVAANFGTITYAEPPGSTFTDPAPSIPDRDLGWELKAGFVWELLDGWAVSGRFSYWKPGKWFNYACIDKAVLNWDIPSGANNWGVNPDRTIDPVFGFEIQIGTTY